MGSKNALEGQNTFKKQADPYTGPGGAEQKHKPLLCVLIISFSGRANSLPVILHASLFQQKLTLVVPKHCYKAP